MRSYEAILLLLLVTSCSVKEDRAGCPCRLTVVNGAESADGVSAFLYDSPTKLEELEVDGCGLECSVPRRLLRVTYLKLPSSMPRDMEMYKIPFGGDCDSLFAFSHFVDCTEEFAVDTLRLNKNFACLAGRFREYEPGSMAIVTGNVCGISIPDLRPVGGAFRYIPEVDGEGRFRVRLPRQVDGSLNMEVCASDGRLLWTYPLGEAILAIPYDWGAPNLKDMEMVIDASKLEVTLEVAPWSGGYGKDEYF